VRIGVDTGGTFTDLLLDAGDGSPLVAHKLLSTPSDPSQAVLRGVREILAKWATVSAEQPGRPVVVHGSTVATNALLEGRTARTAFVTTKGFEDTLWIGRQDRPELFAFEPEKPALPLSRECVVGVDERVAFDGAVLRELSTGEVERVIGLIRDMGVESVAISMLHCYANPAHEQMLAQQLRQALPGVHVTVAHEVLPEFREYERAATCLVNAAVAPVMVRYVAGLEAALPGALRVMSSAGGTLPPEAVLRTPALTVLSGPAGGVIGAWAQAQAGDEGRAITFDMGGTSTDVALCDGALPATTRSAVAGLPLALSMLDIHTVGAGGGSVAWVDAGGALRVGPRSTGADPGPACYGRQKPPLVPTVTDAHVVLGHLHPGAPLAGGLVLDARAAEEAVGRLAAECGLGILECAAGILRVAEATMARAIQHVSLERGHDPREFTLVPFGGAGGLHAARLAELLGMRRVLIPWQPGLLSALGMLASAPLYTFSQAVLARLERSEAAGGGLAAHPAVHEVRESLVSMAREALAAEGIPEAEWLLAPAVDLRYAGQSYEIAVPLDGPDAAEEFARRHEQLYGYRDDGRAVEVTAVRLAAGSHPCPPAMPELAPRDGPLSVEAIGEPVMLHRAGGELRAWRVRRDALCAGDMLLGPLIVTEYSATTVVPLGWRLTVNAVGQLVIEPAEGEH